MLLIGLGQDDLTLSNHPNNPQSNEHHLSYFVNSLVAEGIFYIQKNQLLGASCLAILTPRASSSFACA